MERSEVIEQPRGDRASKERVTYLHNWEEAWFVDWKFIRVPGCDPVLKFAYQRAIEYKAS